MKNIQLVSAVQPHPIAPTCHNCLSRELCLPLGLSSRELAALDDVINHHFTLRKGETLFRMSQPLHALYAVRSGTVKTSILTHDGRVQVIGFHLRGELLGVDAINDGRHPCDATALEDAELCELPFRRLSQLAQAVPAIQQRILHLMSRQIADDEELLALLGHLHADARLAACLLRFSRRHARLGLPEDSFSLPMTRQDLGDYLGLALETISRSLSRFQERGLLRLRSRQVQLLDLPALHSIAQLPHGRYT